MATVIAGSPSNPPPFTEFDEALNALGQVIPASPAEQAWVDAKRMQIELEREGRSMREMSAQQEQQLRGMIIDHERSKAWSQALSMLAAGRGEPYPMPIDETIIARKAFEQEALEEPLLFSDDTEFYFGNLMPNPAGNYTILPYKLPEGESGTAVLYDATGKMVNDYLLYEGYNTVLIATKDLRPGIYLLKLDVEGIILEPKKLQVIE